jgi:hypothetical protein
VSGGEVDGAVFNAERSTAGAGTE